MKFYSYFALGRKYPEFLDKILAAMSENPYTKDYMEQICQRELANKNSHRPNISSVISGYKQPSKSAQSIEITGFIEKSRPPEIIFFYTLLPLTA